MFLNTNRVIFVLDMADLLDFGEKAYKQSIVYISINYMQQ